VSKFIEDAQSVLPSVTRRTMRAGDVKRVAEPDPGLHLPDPITHLDVARQRLPVAVDGLIVVAQVVVSEAERVPRGGLAFRFTEFLKHDQGLLAERQRLLEPPE
jgi:hypothetical protein